MQLSSQKELCKYVSLLHKQTAIEIVHGMDNGIWKLVSLCDLVEYGLGL